MGVHQSRFLCYLDSLGFAQLGVRIDMLEAVMYTQYRWASVRT